MRIVIDVTYMAACHIQRKFYKGLCFFGNKQKATSGFSGNQGEHLKRRILQKKSCLIIIRIELLCANETLLGEVISQDQEQITITIIHFPKLKKQKSKIIRINVTKNKKS